MWHHADVHDGDKTTRLRAIAGTGLGRTRQPDNGVMVKKKKMMMMMMMTTIVGDGDDDDGTVEHEVDVSANENCVYGDDDDDDDDDDGLDDGPKLLEL